MEVKHSPQTPWRWIESEYLNQTTTQGATAEYHNKSNPFDICSKSDEFGSLLPSLCLPASVFLHFKVTRKQNHWAWTIIVITELHHGSSLLWIQSSVWHFRVRLICLREALLLQLPVIKKKKNNISASDCRKNHDSVDVEQRGVCQCL